MELEKAGGRGQRGTVRSVQPRAQGGDHGRLSGVGRYGCDANLNSGKGFVTDLPPLLGVPSYFSPAVFIYMYPAREC